MIGDLHLEVLHWRHLREWGLDLAATDAQLAATPMVGWAYRNDWGRLVALGGVRWEGEAADVPVAFLDATPSFRADPRSRRVHRLALTTFDAVMAVEPAIYAWVDEAVPRARVWMERLGFKAQENGLWIYGAISPRGDCLRRRDGDAGCGHDQPRQCCEGNGAPATA